MLLNVTILILLQGEKNGDLQKKVMILTFFYVRKILLSKIFRKFAT